VVLIIIYNIGSEGTLYSTSKKDFLQLLHLDYGGAQVVASFAQATPGSQGPRNGIWLCSKGDNTSLGSPDMVATSKDGGHPCP
jgi:hypothetical protein